MFSFSKMKFTDFHFAEWRRYSRKMPEIEGNSIFFALNAKTLIDTFMLFLSGEKREKNWIYSFSSCTEWFFGWKMCESIFFNSDKKAIVNHSIQFNCANQLDTHVILLFYDSVHMWSKCTKHVLQMEYSYH